MNTENAIVVLSDREQSCEFGDEGAFIIIPKTENGAEYIKDIDLEYIISDNLELYNDFIDECSEMFEDEIPHLSNDDFVVLTVNELLDFYMKNKK